MEMDESLCKSLDQVGKKQEKIKNTYDKRAKTEAFELGTMVLLWDTRREKPNMHNKLNNL